MLKGQKHSDETRKKMSLKKIGHTVSAETRIKIGKNSPGMKGKKHTDETKKKISESHKGEKCYMWEGGKSFEEYTLDWTNILRASIRTRDNYICQECGIHQDELSGYQKKLDVHHIDYDKKNCNPDNLITLCRGCHQRTNVYRDKWLKYFKSKFQ